MDWTEDDVRILAAELEDALYRGVLQKIEPLLASADRELILALLVQVLNDLDKLRNQDY